MLISSKTALSLPRVFKGRRPAASITESPRHRRLTCCLHEGPIVALCHPRQPPQDVYGAGVHDGLRSSPVSLQRHSCAWSHSQTMSRPSESLTKLGCATSSNSHACDRAKK